MTLDKKEVQDREDLELSRDRAKTFRYWLDASLVASLLALAVSLLICVWLYLIPAISSWKKVSDESARGWQETVQKAGPEIIELIERTNSTMERVDRIASNLESTTKKLDKELPNSISQISSVAGTLNTKISSVTSNLDNLIVHTDFRINGESGLLHQTTTLASNLAEIASKSQATIDEINSAIKLTSDELNLSTHQIYTILSSSELKSILTNVERTSLAVADSSAHVEEALRQAPSISQSLDKIAKTSSKYQKIVLISGIISTIVRALLP